MEQDVELLQQCILDLQEDPSHYPAGWVALSRRASLTEVCQLADTAAKQHGAAGALNVLRPYCTTLQRAEEPSLEQINREYALRQLACGLPTIEVIQRYTQLYGWLSRRREKLESRLDARRSRKEQKSQNEAS